jgi:hypothetical protein
MMMNLVGALLSNRIFLVLLASWNCCTGDRHVLLSKRHAMEELALLLGDDQCLSQL